MGPLLTYHVSERLADARRSGSPTLSCSLDLRRSTAEVGIHGDSWVWNDVRYPYFDAAKERTVYYWAQGQFQAVARYGTSLIKLIPTEWGPPTFEIDGIKMLPTAQVSPYLDAQQKVALIRPRGKVVLDCCGGLGYFAAWCMQEKASRVVSFEKNADVIWLRTLNPWSPTEAAELSLNQADVTAAIATLADSSIDAALHDPPRFGIAGELYSQNFYSHLARVLRRRGRLFHYTGAPNKLSGGRDVAQEVITRLGYAGFTAKRNGDGVLAIKD